MNFSEYFTTAAIAERWVEIEAVEREKNPYIGPILFPAQKKAGLDLAWLKGSRGLAVSLMPSAFDAKATYRDRIGFEKLETEMPFFREGFKIKERDRQELLRVADANDPYARAIIGRVYDDSDELIKGANVVPERMICQLLFPENGNAGISILANGVDYTYNYDEKGKWKNKNYTELKTTEKWDAPETSDPFITFKNAKDAALSNTGTMLEMAVMNTATFNMMRKSKAISDRYITASGNARAYLMDYEVKAIMKDLTGIEIKTYDRKYNDESKNMHSFVPDGYVCFIPSGPLGTTWYGTTPEEADLMGSGEADVSIVNTGVAITKIIEKHPVNINLLASEIVLPSFERMDDVQVVKVA